MRERGGSLQRPCWIGDCSWRNGALRQGVYAQKHCLFQKCLKKVLRKNFLKEMEHWERKLTRMSSEDKPELIPTRQSLLSRLRDWKDHQSWQEFFEIYWKLIYSTAVKAGLTDAEAQDVVQETVISVSKKMPGFHYDPGIGSFKSWLLRLTYWRITDQFRKRTPHRAAPLQQPAGFEPFSLDRIPDPKGCALEDFWNQEWEKNVVDAAIQRIKRKVDPKQFQIFDLYVLKHWPVSKIAKTLQVSAGRIYLAKHRVSVLIRKELDYLKESVI